MSHDDLTPRPTDPDRLRGSPLSIHDEKRRLITATWGTRGRVIFFPELNEYREWVVSEEAIEGIYLEDGVAPLRRAHDDTSLEGQIGSLLPEWWIENGQLHLLGQVGYSPLAEWFWRNVSAGIIYGCSLGHVSIEQERVPMSDLPSSHFVRVTRWAPLELTILQARGGRDDRARVACASNLEAVVEEKRRALVARKERARHELPTYYADPLRRRIRGMARNVAARIHHPDPATLEMALREELEEAFRSIDE